MTEYVVTDATNIKNKCPFEGCHRVFNTREDLCSHVKIHKISVCTFCDDVVLFRTPLGYENHVQRKHKASIEDKVSIEVVTLLSDDEDDETENQNFGLPLYSELTLIKAESIEASTEDLGLNDQNQESHYGTIESVVGGGQQENEHLISHQKSHNSTSLVDHRNNGERRSRRSISSSKPVNSHDNESSKPLKRSHIDDNFRKTPLKKKSYPSAASDDVRSSAPSLPVLERYSPQQSHSNELSSSCSPSVGIPKCCPAKLLTMTDVEVDAAESKCHNCDRIFSTTQELCLHLLSHNEEKAKGGSERQLTVEEPRKAITCLLCKKEFDHRANLLIHLNEEHEDGKYRCSQHPCSEVFTKALYLYYHVRNHEESPVAQQSSEKDRRIIEWIKEINESYPFFTNELHQSENDASVPVSHGQLGKKNSSKVSDQSATTVGCREGGCQAIFTNVHELKYHRETCHPQSEIIHCSFENCNVPFNRHYLKLHKKRDHGVNF